MKTNLFQIDYDDYDSYLDRDDRVGNDYIRAQQDGHFHQDCSYYEEDCPTSLFGVSFSRPARGRPRSRHKLLQLNLVVFSEGHFAETYLGSRNNVKHLM